MTQSAPSAPPPRPTRPPRAATWPWIVMPLIVLVVFWVLRNVHRVPPPEHVAAPAAATEAGANSGPVTAPGPTPAMEPSAAPDPAATTTPGSEASAAPTATGESRAPAGTP